MEQDQLLWQASNKYHLHIVFPTIPQKKSNSDFAHQEYNQKESENRITYSKKLKKRFLGTTYRPPPIQKSNNQKNHIKTPPNPHIRKEPPFGNFLTSYYIHQHDVNTLDPKGFGFVADTMGLLLP